ncbi:MAG: site-specific integrase [Chloroflexota bacterium]
MTDITPRDIHDELAQSERLTFNFAAALIGRASSRHTERAYFRWVDRYLSDMTRLEVTTGQQRIRRMEAVPLTQLLPTMSARHLRVWLGRLLREGNGAQGIGQARAAIVTLADLLAEAELMEFEQAAGMARVRPPKAADGQRPGRWLSPRQLRELIAASQRAATSDNQALRNTVVLSVLCTMALRRDELASARWEDLSIQNDRMVMRVHGKGKKTAVIDVPNPVARTLAGWRKVILTSEHGFDPHSPLVRRLWKGGGVSRNGLTADGIWAVVKETSAFAGIGDVAPHDLRRSVAGALHENGVPIEKISALLRHSNVAVTERYLSRLPQINEGALLMSDVLGLDDWDADDDGDWFAVDVE